MTKKPTLLERMNSASITQWLDHESGRTQTSLDDILNPSKAYLAKQSDDDLHELMAAKPNTREGQIAASIMRVREAWRTPARWSLIVSGLALALSAVAFARTL